MSEDTLKGARGYDTDNIYVPLTTDLAKQINDILLHSGGGVVGLLAFSWFISSPMSLQPLTSLLSEVQGLLRSVGPLQ